MAQERLDIVIRQRGAEAVLRDLDRLSAISTRGASAVSMLQRALLTLGVGVSLSHVVHTFAAFEQQMASVRAVSRASQREFDLLSEAARRMGASTRFSAAEAGAGLEFLARAGFDAEQAIAALPATLDLATGAGMGLAAAADIVSNILSGMGMAVEQTSHLTDVLASVSSRSNVNVQQLGESMKFVAPVAASLRVPVEELAAAMGVLGDAGIQGSMAGTMLRRVLSDLESPGAKAQKVFTSLGISLEKIRPSAVGLVGVFQELNRAGITFEEAEEAFGRVGVTGALVLSQMSERLAELTQEGYQSIGMSREMAEIMANTLQGRIVSLNSAVSELMIQTGDAGLAGALGAVIENATGVVRVWSNMVDPLDESAESIRRLARHIEGAATALGGLTLAASAPGLLRGLAGLAAFTGIPAVAVLSIIGAAAALVTYREEIHRALDPMERLRHKNEQMAIEQQRKVAVVQRLTEEYRRYAQQTELTEEQSGKFQEVIDQLRREFPELGDSIDGSAESLDGLREAVDRFRLSAELTTVLREFELLQLTIVETEAKLAQLQQRQTRRPGMGGLGIGPDIAEMGADVAETRLERLIEQSGTLQERIRELQRQIREGVDRPESSIVTPRVGVLDEEGRGRLELETARILRDYQRFTQSMTQLAQGLQDDLSLIGLEGIEARIRREEISHATALRSLDEFQQSVLQNEELTATQRQSLLSQAANVRELQERLHRERIQEIHDQANAAALAEQQRQIDRELELERRRFQRLEREAQRLREQYDPGFAVGERMEQLQEMLEHDLITPDIAQRAFDDTMIRQLGREMLDGTVEYTEMIAREYETMYQRIDALRQADLLSEQSANMMKRRLEIEQLESRLNASREFFSALSGLTRSSNRTLFAIGKAAALSEAIIQGHLAIQKALASAPPPANMAAVATATIQTAMNVAQIAAASPGFKTGGEFEVSGVGAPDSQLVVFRATPGERVEIRTPAQQMIHEQRLTTLERFEREVSASDGLAQLSAHGKQLHRWAERDTETNLDRGLQITPLSALADSVPGFRTGGSFTVGRFHDYTQPQQPVASATRPEATQGEGGVRIINVIDPSLVSDYLTSPEGERVLVNVLRRNKSAMREVVA